MGDLFPGFMETEVMPAVAAKYRVLTGPANTAIEGVSYGGVAAVYALIRRPDLFGRGVSRARRCRLGMGRCCGILCLCSGPRRVAFGVGTAEATDEMPNAAVLNTAFVRAVTELTEHFKAISLDPPQVQLTVAQGAHHSTKYFGERFSAALLFLYGTSAAK